MGYTALYRKFRPVKFEELVGQEHITKTIKNQIISDRVGHAYLFNGGRGTGKTTIAKILARAVSLPYKSEKCSVFLQNFFQKNISSTGKTNHRCA